MTQKGDSYFGPAKAKILGGEGTDALGTPTVQTVTGLSLIVLVTICNTSYL